MQQETDESASPYVQAFRPRGRLRIREGSLEGKAISCVHAYVGGLGWLLWPVGWLLAAGLCA